MALGAAVTQVPAMPATSKALLLPSECAEGRQSCPFYQQLAPRSAEPCQGVVVKRKEVPMKKMTTTPSAHSQSLKNSET